MTVVTARGATAARAAPNRAQGGARAAPRRQATRAQLLEFKGSDAAAPPIGAASGVRCGDMDARGVTCAQGRPRVEGRGRWRDACCAPFPPLRAGGLQATPLLRAAARVLPSPATCTRRPRVLLSSGAARGSKPAPAAEPEHARPEKKFRCRGTDLYPPPSLYRDAHAQPGRGRPGGRA